MRYGLGIRIAILIAISDTRISTARRHFAAHQRRGQSAERSPETTEDGRTRDSSHDESEHSGYYGVGPTTHPVFEYRVHDILLVV